MEIIERNWLKDFLSKSLTNDYFPDIDLTTITPAPEHGVLK
jgi:hypothetical protein